MYKFFVVLFLFLIAVGIYEQNNIFLMSEEEKKSIISEKEYEDKKALEENKKDELSKDDYKQRMETLLNTPWSEVKKEQYFEKIIAEKIHLFILIFFIFPAIVMKLYLNSVNVR